MIDPDDQEVTLPEIAEPPESFASKVAIVPSLVAECVLDDLGHDRLSTAEREWFIAFVDWRARYLYRNQPVWRKRLEGEKSRDLTYSFVEHWANAFLNDPSYYSGQKFRDYQSPDPEWQPGGKLASSLQEQPS